jgi:hypothetical protein
MPTVQRSLVGHPGATFFKRNSPHIYFSFFHIFQTGLALSIKPDTSLVFTILDLPARVLSKTGIANRPT